MAMMTCIIGSARKYPRDNGIEGISLLAETPKQIVLGISVNRRIRKGRYTDMAWYLENIIYKLLDIGVRLLSYELMEYED